MIDVSLATIKTLAKVIIANRKGHKRRARNLEVFERETIVLMDQFNAYPLGALHLTTDEMTQVRDGLEAIRVLAHGPLGAPYNETHFDIEQRLYLVMDLCDWLRDKIKESKPYTLFDAMTDERQQRIQMPVDRDADIPF